MKSNYDFSKGKRGRILPPESEAEGKTRITIRLDKDIVDRFLELAEQSGGTSGYQSNDQRDVARISREEVAED